MTKEEFEKYKEDIIKDGRINRSFLIGKWMRDPEHWLPHFGKVYWKKSLRKSRGVKEELEPSETKDMYAELDKERIEALTSDSKIHPADR